MKKLNFYELDKQVGYTDGEFNFQNPSSKDLIAIEEWFNIRGWTYKEYLNKLNKEILQTNT